MDSLKGKKLLLAVEHEQDLQSCPVFPYLRDKFAEATVLTSVGEQTTIETILSERPDVAFLYFDDHPVLYSPVDIQWAIHGAMLFLVEIFQDSPKFSSSTEPLSSTILN